MSIRSEFKMFRYSTIYILCICFICVFAQAGISDDLESSEELILIIGETRPLRVNNPRQVRIGNPTFLDVVGASSTELLLEGLEEGDTMLTVVDDFGSRRYAVKIFVEDMEKLKERVDMLLQAAGFDQLTTKIGYKERKIFISLR